MCIEYFMGILLFAIVIICVCYLIMNSIKTDTELMMAKAEIINLKEQNSALKEVIRKQQIIINANED